MSQAIWIQLGILGTVLLNPKTAYPKCTGMRSINTAINLSRENSIKVSVSRLLGCSWGQPNLRLGRAGRYGKLCLCSKIGCTCLDQLFTEACQRRRGGFSSGLSGGAWFCRRRWPARRTALLALAAGMASAVNPYGLPMLPACLSLYLGPGLKEDEKLSPVRSN